MQDLISVIVPVYKAEEYLRDCVEAILAQTYSNFELWLVDDGSPDTCGKICDELSGRDSRVNVIHQANGGVSAARNSALDVAAGSYICFVDSDDLVSPRMLESLYHAAVAHDAEMAIACNNGIKLLPDADWGVIKVLDAAAALALLVQDIQLKSYVWGRIFKASLFKDIRFPEAIIFEDVWIAHRFFLASNKVVLLNEELYQYNSDNPYAITARCRTEIEPAVFYALLQRLRDLEDVRPDLAAALYSRVVGHVCYTYKLAETGVLEAADPQTLAQMREDILRYHKEEGSVKPTAVATAKLMVLRHAPWLLRFYPVRERL